MKNLRPTLSLVLLCLCFSAHAQRITDGTLKTIVKSTIAAYEKKPFEKLYIQTDKPTYFPGDTIRLKAYLLNGDYRAPSALSGILYVELDNEAGKNIKRMMLPVGDGLAWADMALDTADVKQGNYTLRAYTNWMRNFGEDYIFKKSITVLRHTDNPLLVNSSFKQIGNKMEAVLQLKKLDGKLQALKDVEAKLMSGKKNLSKDKLTTGIDGTLTYNFTLPENNEPINIKLATTGNDEVTLPVNLNRAENTDVQFMPEGGQLVAGLQSKVGIKAIGEDGKGINVSGKLLNSKGEEVGIINTTYKGMGSFMFIPQAGESYIAKFNGINKSYTLPLVKPTGTVVTITASNADLLNINIKATPDRGGNYYLIGQARGVVCYAEPINLLNGVVAKSVDKNLFPTGIVRFTLIGADHQPMNERIVFVNHKDEFHFNIQPDKNSYASRGSISLSLLVMDKEGKPVQGSFSMAVTDNSQVKIDSLGSNILTSLLLTSDLKGNVENPNYYFTGSKEAELDNLMLTQGWVGYDWKELLSPESKPIAYQPEKEYVISGKVTNAFNSPIESSQVNIMSKVPFIVADTLTDKNGRFTFRDIWPVDTAIFKLQARNKNNKEFNVIIKMDEQSFPDFHSDTSTITPWYVNTDTTLLNNAKSQIAVERARDNYKGMGATLNEVNIKAKKAVKRSSNLNGPGEADLVIDEDEMLKAGKKPLENLLYEKIKGFGLGTFTPSKRRYEDLIGYESTIIETIKRDFPFLTDDQSLEFLNACRKKLHKPWRYSYKINNQEVHFIIDGINLDRFYDEKDEVVVENGNSVILKTNDTKRYKFIKSHLEHFTAEDLLGIEVLSSGPYTNRYNSKYEGMVDRAGPRDINEAVYVEITTRTKEGPFMLATIGTYLYKPLAFTLPKQFYSPQYTVNTKNIAPGTDMRSTIFWEPNIITDTAGKATVSFYSADKPVDYSVIIEGTDMSGGLGFGKKLIHAQRITDGTLETIVKSTITAYDKKPFEKLYVQTDKPSYFPGDTIRFKAYLLSGDYRSPSAISGILYAELDDDKGKNVKRMMLPVSDGLAWADMPLDTADVKQGTYTLRAYTNWMRNFGEDYIFKKSITVSRRTDNPLLVNSSFKQTGNKVEGVLQLKTLDGKLVLLKDVEVKLMSGKKNLSKDKFNTGIDGKVKLNFEMPNGNEPLSIKALLAGSAELTIPVALPRPENIDVQFMPEGGALVAGIQSKVGIKAIGEDGRGVNVTGKIYNSKGEEAGIINAAYKGMGSITFTPQAGESYSAKLNGTSKSYPLPAVNLAGTSLSIKTPITDSIIINIQGTNNSGAGYYLIGQARGVVGYSEPVNLSNGKTTKVIAKTLFPTGIARFTLINSSRQPVNERIVFINHKDELRFNIQSDKNKYTTRDSIALSVLVTDKAGKPIQGSFAMAVTDNSQIEVDSLGSNILTNLLLTSDLKGEIEDPNYYFTGNKEIELDNLMLTQGWVGYDWKEILSPESKPIAYQPEKEYVISGTVTNAFGKPIEHSQVNLMSKKPLVVADIITDKNGRFVFKDILPVDTAIFKLQARNKNDKEFNVAIKMDEQTFPGFKPNIFTAIPWYVNTEITMLNNAASKVAEEKAKENFKGTGTTLKEVNIKAKKVVKGSKNLNGPGEADLVLDEKDMLKAGKKTLNDLLSENIPGIKEYGFWRSCNDREPGVCVIPMTYVLNTKKISFIFDGMNIDKFFTDQTIEARRAYIKSYLDYYTAEDITGIELMFQPKYNRAYASTAILTPVAPAPKKTPPPPTRLTIADYDFIFTIPNFDTHAYIEITTRSKQGPFMKVTPGTYLYKPLAFTLPKQFYSPKYTVKNKNTAIGTDMRSTMFWEPNIVTDASGKATVSFYSADKAADYSVIIEGTDMSGGLGFGKKVIGSK